MKEKLRQIRKLLLLTLLGVTLVMPAQVKAAPEEEPTQEAATPAEEPVSYQCEVNIPVKVQVDGSGIPDGNEYTVILTTDSSTPMPTDAVDTGDGKKTVEKRVVNGGEVSFGPITYTAPGDYSYTIYQEAAARDHFTYDTTVYNVTVRVTNTENGGLTAEIWGYRNGEESGEKVWEFLFQNHYARPADPSSPSDDGGNGGDGGGSHENDTTVMQTVVTPAQPEPPAQVVLPPASQTGTGPQTGDEANVMLWAAGALLGAAALIIIAFLGKKNKKA